MKKVEIIVRPHKMDAVKQALIDIGVNGMTVYEVQGFGHQFGHKEQYRGHEVEVEFVNKYKIEVVTCDDKVDQVIEQVITVARTGDVGDGKIFVTPVEQAVRIRTGRTGAEAL